MLTHLLDVIVWRVLRCLERDGLLVRDPEQPLLDLEALVAQARQSITQRAANSLGLGLARDLGYGLCEVLCFRIPDIQRHFFPTFGSVSTQCSTRAIA